MPAAASPALADTPLSVLTGVGPALREKLAARGLSTLQDLWLHLPRGYEDRTTLTAIRDLRPGEPAQVDLARFELRFLDEPDVTRIVWLFSLVLGHSRLIWARFVVHQDLQTVLHFHIAALEAMNLAPEVTTRADGYVQDESSQWVAAAVEAFCAWLWEGSSASRVTGVEVEVLDVAALQPPDRFSTG